MPRALHNDKSRTLAVFVAASLIDLATDVVAGFQSETGTAVDLSPASSRTLAPAHRPGVPGTQPLPSSDC
jgi:ABC-type molybdate transport system substrate-binding protein